jgi:hypothetical protein
MYSVSGHKLSWISAGGKGVIRRAAQDGVPSSSPSVDFGNQNVGTPSAAQTVTVTNPTTAPVSGVTINLSGTNQGDFAQTNTCGTSVSAGASCTVSVTFYPRSPAVARRSLEHRLCRRITADSELKRRWRARNLVGFV